MGVYSGRCHFCHTFLEDGDCFEGIGAVVSVLGTQPALGGKVIGSKVIDKSHLFFR